VTDEQAWIDHRVRTYYAGMDPGDRAALDYRVRWAIDDDGARRERARQMVGLVVLRHRSHHTATEEEVSTIFALSGPWSWQSIRGADAEQAIERLEAERGRPNGPRRGGGECSLGARPDPAGGSPLGARGAIDAAAQARERAVTTTARQRTTARSDELSREWLAAVAHPNMTRRRRSRPTEPPYGGVRQLELRRKRNGAELE
jgi:hypothetical protein